MTSEILKSLFKKITKSRRRMVISILAVLFILWYIFCLPKQLFTDPTSTLLLDKDNKLLSARIANDGQWRFPPSDSIPEKFEHCIIYFEDQYFKYHPGINPVSIIKAVHQNIKRRSISRGGSTITSQVIRLSRKGKKRTIKEKLLEFILATRLELKNSKEEILNLYASNAPFGGNVVGLDAASWRYYGRPPTTLSWGETATLAVLPNAPGLIYPGKGHEALLLKRNRLLDKLLANSIIDSLTCSLAKYEPLPEKPHKLPLIAPHLIDRVIKEGHEGEAVQVTIDIDLQKKCNRILDKYHKLLKQNEIHNAAAIVIDVSSGNTLAYLGNTTISNQNDAQHVDIISSQRSSGSTLKPFLYSLMQKEGQLLPHTLVADIPTRISDFSPKNFNKKFDGAVPASNALARSLNIPAVRMLRSYGLEKFHSCLSNIGISSIKKHPDHYGLSLILGGAEVSLWELSSTYAAIARMLNNYLNNSSQYNKNNYQTANLYANADKLPFNWIDTDPIEAGPAYLTFEALTEMTRPIDGENWYLFNSSKKIAWKTGTSFGHRDAWAIGVTPEFAVGVWVGNADGEGRPGLTGASTAAPVMFDIFRLLPETSWWVPPYDDLTELVSCKHSGHKAGIYCLETDTLDVAIKGVKTTVCPYHKQIFLNKKRSYRVSSECYKVKDMLSESWFVLPPIMEWFYKSHDPFYKTLPPFHPDCQNTTKNMELIYPQRQTELYIPKGFGGTKQSVVFEAAHRIAGTNIHWHVNDEYLGQTNYLHQMEVNIGEGEHTVTLVSEDGESIERRFSVLSK